MPDPLGLEDDVALPVAPRRKPGRPPGAKNKPRGNMPPVLHPDPPDPAGLPGVGLSMKIGQAVNRGNEVLKPPKPKPPKHWKEKGPRDIPLTPSMNGTQPPEWNDPGPEPRPGTDNPWPEGSTGWETWNNWLDEHYPVHTTPGVGQDPVFPADDSLFPPRKLTPSEQQLKDNPPVPPPILLPAGEMTASAHMHFGYLFS